MIVLILLAAPMADTIPEEFNPEEWLLETDRKRGMLTRDDRQFLLGEKKLDDAGKYSTRHRIRRRINRTVRDLAFLSRTEKRDIIGDCASRVHPMVRPTLISEFVKNSIDYGHSEIYRRDSKSDDPDQMADALYRVEDIIADSIEDIVTGREYSHVDSVEVNIDIDGVKTAADNLLDEFLEDYNTIVSRFDTWQYYDGDPERLKKRLSEADEELIVWKNEVSKSEIDARKRAWADDDVELDRDSDDKVDRVISP